MCNGLPAYLMVSPMATY